VPIGSAEYLKEKNPTCEVAVRGPEGEGRDGRDQDLAEEIEDGGEGGPVTGRGFRASNDRPIKIFYGANRHTADTKVKVWSGCFQPARTTKAPPQSGAFFFVRGPDRKASSGGDPDDALAAVVGTWA
jgi:hypothetical protein